MTTTTITETKKGYNSNGQLRFEKNYKNGKLDGLQREYFDDGQLMWVDTYENGKLIK